VSGRLPRQGRAVERQSRQFNGPQVARVHNVDAAGVHFTLRSRPDELLGPALWQRPQGAAGPLPDPPRGTLCLVVFVGTGIAEPWVIAFSGWPTA
jgi:hypothetical protein